MSSFYKRSLLCFVLTLSIMLVCIMRVMVIANDSKLSEAATIQSNRRVNIKRNRGRVFDCNNNLLTDKYFDQMTVVFPSESGVFALKELLSGDELAKQLEALKNGQVVKVFKMLPNKLRGAKGLYVPDRYTNSLTHVLGYVGADGHGVSGVEKFFDDVLFSEQYLSVSYAVDSLGRMLEGIEPEVINTEHSGKVILTIDENLQRITESAMKDVSAGAAVILEAKTGKLKAVVSCPNYDCNDVASALTAEKSPLINRATYLYNVGSVFKPLIAAAALENGLANYTYNCTGSFTVGDVTFKCNKSSGHKELGLSDALAYSCNTYFYTLGMKLGAETLYDMAKAMRFGEEFDCNGGLVSTKGSLPSLEKLTTLPAELVNLSIGQGDLMLSPIAMAVMYSAIVNDGTYRLPYIVQSVENNGEIFEYKPSPVTVAFSKSTADALKEHLKYALKNGTGKSAYIEGVSSGGKTGTAQTGWVTDQRSILNGWFCGFYEGYQDYVIIVLKEDVKSASSDCAPIFKTIIHQMNIKGY